MFLKIIFESSMFMFILATPMAIGSFYIYEQIKEDKSQTAYSYYIPIMYYIVSQIGILYIWIILIWFNYAGNEMTLGQLMKSIWMNNFRLTYPIILMNEIFSFVIALYGSFDKKLTEYSTTQLFFYASSFFVCNHVYQLYSRYILRRPNINLLPYYDRRLFILYEYVFYFQTLIIFVSFYYSIQFDDLHISMKPLIKFLINHLMFHIFEITKIYLIINMFIFSQFLQVIIDGVGLILHFKQATYIIIGITITSIVLSFAYNLHILGQYYIHLRNCRGGQFVENNPQQIQMQIPTDFLRDEDVEKLEVKTFNSDIENKQKKTQAIDLAQLEDQNNNTLQCSVCGNDFLKKDKIIILDCSHLFHSECLVPWLKLKNSCPNCRTQVARML